MRFEFPEIPNITKDMVAQEESERERRIREAEDRAIALAEIQEAKSDWAEVAALSDHRGWGHLTRMVEQQIERLRAVLEKPVPDLPTHYIRGGIYALRWLAQVPDLAEAAKVAVEEQGRIVLEEMKAEGDEDGA